MCACRAINEDGMITLLLAGCLLRFACLQLNLNNPGFFLVNDFLSRHARTLVKRNLQHVNSASCPNI